MEHIKAHFLEIFKQDEDLISLMAVNDPHPYSPLINGMDLLLIVVSSNFEHSLALEHVRMGSVQVQIRRVTPANLEHWVSGGETRSSVQWLVQGEILLDRDNYLLHFRQRMETLPEELRGRKQLKEFGCFVQTYLQAKQDLQDGNLLDAYSNTINALHHWANIVLVEAGVYPELALWRQMRRFDPGIYKLYEELTISTETLEQRVQLVMLACEFSFMSKMKSCCEFLFSILTSREEPWSIADLQSHPLLADLQIDLSLLIRKLVMRGYVKEVAVIPFSGDTDSLELRYRCETV
ncbi:nucleotidyltransferase-like protein [Paenibacillus mendelii]|uniref:Nucleotidyltransferase-like protein n=1 Tax=Paenibacillus mendelii TaxID=206163 RepID=A0ABV6JBP9_9BACL|nr:nucleotidyltransferase-like protein [Paenibacillus mendelii]MCQ6562573.1 nucleotidyltransferase-like protein [Paenibacillus mendelii]